MEPWQRFILKAATNTSSLWNSLKTSILRMTRTGSILSGWWIPPLLISKTSSTTLPSLAWDLFQRGLSTVQHSVEETSTATLTRLSWLSRRILGSNHQPWTRLREQSFSWFERAWPLFNSISAFYLNQLTIQVYFLLQSYSDQVTSLNLFRFESSNNS